MAWTIINRVRGRSVETEDPPAPDLRSLIPGQGQNPAAHPAGAQLPDQQVVKVAEPAQQPTPAFARKAAVEGGAPSQPAFAHSPFTPTRPISSERGLVGRRKQLDRAISAVQIERAHLTIFGERGNGKTSFANVLASLAEDAGYGVVRHTCTTQPSFGELFGAVVAKIPPRFLRPVMADDEVQSFGRRQIWTVASAVAKLQEIRAGHVLIMIDEFDRLSDEDAKRDMTELLKTTSDLSVRVSFVLIGVAESMGELMELHPSLARTMVAIPLPLLPDNDVSMLLEKGCKDLRLAISQRARRALLLLTQGSPYFAQLLSLHASDSAVRRKSRELTLDDVASAIILVLEETHHSFEPMLAGMPRVDPRWPDLLFAAACAECNGFGWFTAAAVSTSATQQGMALPRDLTFGLSVLASPDGGSILKMRRMPGTEEFAFARVNLRNYVLMREAARRKVVSRPPEAEHSEVEFFADGPAPADDSPEQRVAEGVSA
jgi:type II secretory pathway predicted ATPase ExeA